MARLLKKDGEWYLADGAEMIGVEALLPEGYQITEDTPVVEVIGKLIQEHLRTGKLTPKERALLKRWGY